MKLNPEQVSQISQKISSNQVYYTDIRAELTDHIACKIEAKLTNEQDFEEVLQKSLEDVNPKKFQRRILILSHLGMAKNLFRDMLRPTILFKSAVLCATWILMIFLFDDLSPAAASKHIKTLMISGLLGMAMLSFSRDLLKSSSLVAEGNTFWLVFCFGQFALNMDLLIFLGLSAEIALYTIIFLLSLIYVSGLYQVTRQF
jgi:hypothetical protein